MIDYETFEEMTQQLINQYKVPNSIVAIARHGKIVYEQTFGYGDVNESKPVTKDTIFGIASLTKSFTAVAIMQLADAGKLDIHAPVSTYLTNYELKDKLKEATIFHLMTHSSGLPPLSTLDEAMIRERNEKSMVDYLDQNGEQTIKTYDDLIKAISRVNLHAKPGALFSYSNDAYGLLGAIIENVSNMTYEQYVFENVLKRCGMSNTFFRIPSECSNVAIKVEQDEESGEMYVVQDWWDAPPMRATGFLKSTAQDMITYATLFITDGIVNGTRILSAKSVQQMIQPYMKMNPEKYYGFGLAITTNYYGEKLIDHGGSLQSISSKFAIIPEAGLTVIVLANLSGFPASRIMEYALSTYYERDLEAHHFSYPSYKVDAKKLALYVGEYYADEGMKVVLKIIDGTFFFSYKDALYKIKFISETIFQAYIDDVTELVEIIVNENGVAEAIAIFHRVVPRVSS